MRTKLRLLCERFFTARRGWTISYLLWSYVAMMLAVRGSAVAPICLIISWLSVDRLIDAVVRNDRIKQRNERTRIAAAMGVGPDVGITHPKLHSEIADERARARRER